MKMMTFRPLARGARLVLASHNQGKIQEFRSLFAPSDITILSAGELSLPQPEETANDFTGNAAIKALAASRASGLPALSDDSGFCVEALGGRPGVYSARWAGPDGDADIAMRRVHTEMEGASDTRAAFVAVLCLAWPDGTTHFVEGRCAGHIVWPPRGKNGHGYDPMFVPQGSLRTFAEMTPEEKNALSHRGKALTLFLNTCVKPDAS